jgi:hypothetical protein
MCDAKLTRAEQVRARAFSLAIETVAGRGNRTFLDIFPRAEEIEVWLYKAREPRLVAAGAGDIHAELNGRHPGVAA